MERSMRPIQVTLKPERFVAMCRCVKDDFEAYCAECQEYPDEDNSRQLDRMEEDIDLLEGLLPYLRSEKTEEGIRLEIAKLKDKLKECY